MNILLLKSETDKRIALTPSDIKKLSSQHKCFVKSNLGSEIGFSDEMFQESGAEILKTEHDFVNKVKTADIFISTKIIGDESIIKNAKKGSLFITHVNQFLNSELVAKYQKNNLSIFAMEKIPRITRTQNMDILSSQSNIAGYKSVLVALQEYQRACPMMTTAAGTVKPARFLIIGAGVAGLQAIATAKRLGGVVYVFDVRSAAKEQVESLGGNFVEIKTNENLETDGGYAKETSQEYKEAQQALLKEQVKLADIIITTANIPSKKAPILITEEMIKTMKQGSIIVDLAAEMGGNTELTENNKTIQKYNATIIGNSNFASEVAETSSTLFSKNIYNLLNHIIKNNTLDKSDSELNVCYL